MKTHVPTALLLISVSLGVWASLPATAAPRSYALPDPTAQLRPAPDRQAGFEAAQANCLTCHSVDYVAMQPPGKGQAFWASEVTKMIKVYHAPISEADGKAIADYLAAAY
ncbi:cytochrome c [Methylobacterium sp. J-068]|uniref:SorB family sulfite dehydrogenase c-type cytochrome subunit n=1 Tax=Methylobacterium sp. J-068 TaxID=2836649 RepID=UPI001FB9481D|nr:cytochrome c [Methylobacterium sp. J-068]MCJ2036336.1 cytochrome c [Methylobacterium sp. J-068]